MTRTGDLIAAGRDADIYAFGETEVLRRSRNARSMLDESRTMRHLHDLGYPVPMVTSVSEDGTEIVMERIFGPTMLDEVGSTPWRLGKLARVLASLHEQLHEVEAPAWLPISPSPGTSILHLDLHPMNVIMSEGGPVVIDWNNAQRGEASYDVAFTWVLLAAGEVHGSLAHRAVAKVGRDRFIKSFLAPFDEFDVKGHLARAIDVKLTDPNMSDQEVATMRTLRSRHAA